MKHLENLCPYLAFAIVGCFFIFPAATVTAFSGIFLTVNAHQVGFKGTIRRIYATFEGTL